MKLKNLSLITTAIALCLTAIPLNSVQAQNTPKTQPQPAQTQQQAQPLRIQLSPQQQNEIKKIRAGIRTKIEKVLTKQQREQIQAAINAGTPPQQAFAALQFTPQQQTELRNIMVASQQQMEAVLTPGQKQELQRYRENLRRQQQPK